MTFNDIMGTMTFNDIMGTMTFNDTMVTMTFNDVMVTKTFNDIMVNMTHSMYFIIFVMLLCKVKTVVCVKIKNSIFFFILIIMT